MLYAPGDSRRDRAYSSSMSASIWARSSRRSIAGTLGEEVWLALWLRRRRRWACVAALIDYLYGWRSLPAEHRARRTNKSHSRLTGAEWKSVGALVLLVIPVTLWWACYEQQGNTIALWFDGQYRSRFDSGRGELADSCDLVSVLQPVHDFRFTPFLIALWAAQAKKNREPNSMTRWSMAAFCRRHLYAWSWPSPPGMPGRQERVGCGRFSISPGHCGRDLSFAHFAYRSIPRSRPLRIASLMMAVNFLPNFLGGGFLQGWLGTYWDNDEQAGFLPDDCRHLRHRGHDHLGDGTAAQAFA